MNTLKRLEELSEGTDLKAFVATWILGKAEDYDQLESVFSDLFYGGCVSGMVSELIYYADTNAFYDEYEQDIWELLERQTEELGHDNPIQMIGSFNGADSVGGLTQFKNWLAWYGFEETAREISYELEIEV